jgi:secreted PhoX family phosphatase
MHRRQFLHRAIAAGAGGAVLPSLALAAGPAAAQTATPGEGPYGPLATEPDENGLLLPEGFTSRIVAKAGDEVGDSGYSWPAFPDGAATFEMDDGGWIHTVNSEIFDFIAPKAGGASAIRYDADGKIVDAYRILEGSTSNCAGGPTPWGTWLSCEEAADEQGRVWECDPTGEKDAVAHDAMGHWAHEAVAVDPVNKALYLTQDNPTGLLYRYTPTSYPDLSAGKLEAAVVADDGAVTWKEVPDPSGTSKPTREQVPGATVFPGGEGIWFHDGTILFTTKYDNRVHAIDIAEQRHEVIWKGDPDRLGVEGAVLSGVDNITVDVGHGDIYVAEDGGNMELVMISAEGVVSPFVRITGEGQDASEVTGPCFNPAGDRLYFSSQRAPVTKGIADVIPGTSGDGNGLGVTYEVTGPFRGVTPAASPSTTGSVATTLARAADGQGSGSSGDDGGSDGDSSKAPLIIGGAVAAAAVVGAVVALRRRGDGAPAGTAATSPAGTTPAGTTPAGTTADPQATTEPAEPAEEGGQLDG